MKRYLISNKEVFLVSYVVTGENPEDAIRRWQSEEGEEVNMEYVSDLNDYTKYSIPDIQEIGEDEFYGPTN